MICREHDAPKRQPTAFSGYFAKDHTGRTAPASDVITVPSHTKEDNPEGLPSPHLQTSVTPTRTYIVILNDREHASGISDRLP